MGLPPTIGLDIHESGRKYWILAVEAGKRLALDQLIPGHSSGHTDPPDGSTYYLRKTKLCFMTMEVTLLGKRNFKFIIHCFFLIFT